MDKSKSNLYGAQSSKINSRILNEIKNLQTHPSPLFHAAPMENDMHVWHFTLRGYPESVFSRGLYHGVIKLPKEYPLKAPDIQFFTPNGRFKVNTNICLSASGFHPESWTPLWKVRNLVEAIGAFMLSEDAGIGRVDSSDA
jgi:ubiquitin-conjugating enzyme E2 J1